MSKKMTVNLNIFGVFISNIMMGDLNSTPTPVVTKEYKWAKMRNILIANNRISYSIIV